MRIGLISRGAEIHSTGRLLEAGRDRGHQMEVLPVLRSVIIHRDGEEELRIERRAPGVFDAVIPRIGTFMPELGLAVLRHLERSTPVINRSLTIERSRSKLLTAELLNQAGLPTPATVFVKDLDQLDYAVEAVGGAPVVIKPVVGTQGQGLVLCESVRSAASAAEAFLVMNREIVIQRFVSEAAGRDLRLLVVGDEVVAAIARQAPDGEFRANVHQGARCTPLDPDPELSRMAVAAARCLGLEVAGVDLLESREGPRILEVNGSPGLEGIEGATGIDVASRIIEHAERRHADRIPGVRSPGTPNSP